jgi:hypothetical protein
MGNSILIVLWVPFRGSIHETGEKKKKSERKTKENTKSGSSWIFLYSAGLKQWYNGK